MCTVSYIFEDGNIFITSNRDEHIKRPVAIFPYEHTINGNTITYPQDLQAGGTWFAVSNHGYVAILLNGAFEKHTPNPPYARSRGLVLLDIVSDVEPMQHFIDISLAGIEPFTLILFGHRNLLELRWDGMKKHQRKLDSTDNYIWSSVTLYDAESIQNRSVLFNEFCNQKQAITASSILKFHKSNHGDFVNGFIINRTSGLKTVSVSQLVIDEFGNTMQYEDILNEALASVVISFDKILHSAAT